jgi:hypothetical protein
MKTIAGLFLFAALAGAQTPAASTATVTGTLAGTLTVAGTGVSGSMPVSGTVAITYPTGTTSPTTTATVTGTLSGALALTGTGLGGSMQVTGPVTITYPTGNTPPPPPTCSPFTDPLTGASGTALNPVNWTQPTGFNVGGGTAVQNSGVAQANAKYRGGGAILTSCPSSLTPYVQFVVSAVDGLGAIQGLLLTTTTGNGYSISLNNSGVNNSISKCTAGKCTYLGPATCSAAFAATNTFKTSAVIVSGNSIAISVWRNGVLCGTVNDTASPYTTGFSGFAIYANGSATGDQISQPQLVN